MKGPVILAVDHGTSAVKCALVSARGEILASARKPTPIRFFAGGGAEQDPADWWEALLETAGSLVGAGHVPAESIRAVCVSSTFSSTVPVGFDGEPVCQAITWMDSRGGPHVQKAMEGFPSILGYGLPKVLAWVPRTGGAPSLSGKDDIGHMLFLQHERPDLYEKTRVFLPSKDWFNYKLSGEISASFDSMSLFWVLDIRNPDNIRYDDGLIRALGIHREKLPPMVTSVSVIGKLRKSVADTLGLSRNCAVVSGSPDHQCACVGAGCVEDFAGHLYIGTSSWIQCVVPFKKTDPLHSIASLPTSIPGKYYAANEQDLAGGCVEFAVDHILRLSRRGKKDVYARFEEMAREAPAGAEGLVFAPWLNGERTPVDDPHLGGALFNLRKTSRPAHIARAVYEGVAANSRWSLKYVEKFIRRKMPAIAFVGGGAKSDLWCRVHADMLNRVIKRPVDPMEANARGAAFIGLVGLGELSFSDVPGLVAIEREFEPDPRNREAYDRLFSAFAKIYSKNKGIFRFLNG